MKQVMSLLIKNGFENTKQTEFCWHPRYECWGIPKVYHYEYGILDSVTVEIFATTPLKSKVIAIFENHNKLLHIIRLADKDKMIYVYSDSEASSNVNAKKLCDDMVNCLHDEHHSDIKTYNTLKLFSVNRICRSSVFAIYETANPMYEFRLSDKIYDALEKFDMLEYYEYLFDLMYAFAGDKRLSVDRSTRSERKGCKFGVYMNIDEKRLSHKYRIRIVFHTEKMELKADVLYGDSTNEEYIKMSYRYDIMKDTCRINKLSNIIYTDEILLSNLMNDIFVKITNIYASRILKSGKQTNKMLQKL